MNRILLLAPRFYGLELKIRSNLEDSGYEVVYIENCDLPLEYRSKSSAFKWFRKIYFLFFSPRRKYLKRCFNSIPDLNFNILFSINCHINCRYLFRRLKNVNPGMKSVLFLWDTLSRYSWHQEIKRFDKVYTFDRKDSEKYRLQYKPNFFLKYTGDHLKVIKNDLFFAGKFSADRLILLETVIAEAERKGLSHDIILHPSYRKVMHSKLIYKALKYTSSFSRRAGDYALTYEVNESVLSRPFIKHEKAAYDEIINRMMESNVVLDISPEGQSGYTHRLIQGLVNGRKVLTTNIQVLGESFYNADQIRILDREKVRLDSDWIKEKRRFNSPAELEDLEISDWLKSIFDESITGQKN